MYRSKIAEEKDLVDVLRLQQSNLKKNLNPTTIIEQGFVTVNHNLELLSKMNSPYPHQLIMYNELLVAYALVMLPSIKSEIPILIPLFENLERSLYDDQKVIETDFFIMGQICIDINHRSKGLFFQLYDDLEYRMSEKFNYIITEISINNTRSMKAHLNYGFDILSYHVENNEEWAIVIKRITNREK